MQTTETGANGAQQAQSGLVVVQVPLAMRRTLEEAQSELEREYNVRDRCFPRWVSEGRLSKIDAEDRLERQKKALECVTFLLDAVTAAPSS